MFTMTDMLKELYIIKTNENTDLNELIDFSCDSDVLKLMDKLEEHKEARLAKVEEDCKGFKLSDVWDKVPHDRHIADHVIDMYDQGYSREKIEEYLKQFERTEANFPHLGR